MDNIASEADDEYNKKFERVEYAVGAGAKLIAELRRQTCRDHRIPVIIKLVEHQQKTMEEIYDLLVEMNNTFAGASK